MTASAEELPGAADGNLASALNDAELQLIRSGSGVAQHADMHRGRVAGWQLPYLRVALILRKLQYESREGIEPYLVKREIANVERVRSELHRAGWFN
jgi:hypothetical protein